MLHILRALCFAFYQALLIRHRGVSKATTTANDSSTHLLLVLDGGFGGVLGLDSRLLLQRP